MLKVRTTALPAAFAVALLAGTVGTAHAAQIFTNNYSDKQIAALSIGGDGVLAPVAGSPFAQPAFPRGLGFSPDGTKLISTFLFEPSIGSFAVAPGGSIAPIGGLAASSAGGTPAISPDGRFAFVVSGSGGVDTFAISNGPPTKVAGPAGESQTEMATLTPDGRFLFLPNSTQDAIERFAVGSDGSLTELPSTPAVSNDAYVMRVTPDGRLALLLSDSNFEPTDELRTFAIGADGSLTQTGFSFTTVGASTGIPAISPNGRFAYVVNSNEGSISAVAIDAAGGLGEVGAPTPTELTGPRDVTISADGRFLYVEPGFEGELQAFSIAPDGTLAKVGAPVSTGGETDGSTPIARPSAPVATFAATPAGPRTASLFDAGASSDTGATIVSYRWDFGDGTTLTTSDPQARHTYREAGVYSVHLSVHDDNGCHGFVYTGQSAYCGGSDATFSLDTPPAIYRLAAKPASFPSAATSARKRASKRSTTFRYALSEKARVRFAIERPRPGRKVGKKCVRETRANAGKRRCTRFSTVGKLKAKGKAGKNKRRFSGKLRGRPLEPGPYRVTATAVDPAGGKSAPRRAAFKVEESR